MVDALQPGREPQQVEADHVALPLVGSVVLGVGRGQLLEVGDALFGRERVLRSRRGDGQNAQDCGEPESTSHDMASSS
ncbi:hypothetical protein D3C83_22960 [compost metagenome]